MNRHHHGGHLHALPEVHDLHLLHGEITLLRDQLAEVTLERDDARLEVARLCMGRLLESAGYVDCDQPALQLVERHDA